MQIKKILVMTALDSTDRVTVYTDLPTPFPQISSQPLTLFFEVVKGHGVRYVQKNFPGHEVWVLDTKTGETHLA